MSSTEHSPRTTKRPATGRIAIAAALLGAVVFVCVNIVSAKLLRNARVDLTQQHLYSLSQGTRALLGELKEPVRFRMFMSSALTKQAPQLAAFAGRVRSLLDSYAAAANGNITACTVCHGGDLRGLGPVPPLAGRSPSYMARQLYDMQRGNRNGAWTPLMAAVTAQLGPDDLLTAAAYLASLKP